MIVPTQKNILSICLYWYYFVGVVFSLVQPLSQKRHFSEINHMIWLISLIVQCTDFSVVITGMISDDRRCYSWRLINRDQAPTITPVMRVRSHWSTVRDKS